MAENLKEAYLLNPPTVTPQTVATPLFPSDTTKYAFWVMVLLRDIGTATYVRIGDNININDSLLGAGDFRIYDVPPGYFFDAAKLYCISDTADAVLEIQGLGPGF